MVILENSSLRLEILPSRGGKILSIWNKENGAEWLYRGESDGFPAPESYRRRIFDEKEAFGMDEMFPTINPEEITDPSGSVLTLPDHGEIWSRSWEVVQHSSKELNLKVEGSILPYTFSRDLLLENNRILLRYRAGNPGDAPIPALWTPHPLFSFYDETEILVPDELDTIRQAMADGPLGEYGSLHSLAPSGDIPGAGNLLHPGTLPEGSAFKFYGEKPLKEGYCGLKDRRGRLTFTYPAEQIPWLGFWINRKGWGNQQNLALEPATAPMDGPKAAEKFKVTAQLKSREVWEWEMVIEIR